jgi:UDP-N-acetylmuramoylalanine--D-glutamate ligase
MSDWSGRKVAIIGAARQGLALARYLIAHGAQVVITDRQPLEALAEARQSLAGLEASGRLKWVAGGHPLELLDGVDLLCPSGGAPLTLHIVEEAVRRGIRLSNDSQIFLEAAPCRVIGITGSAGKTTTTTLVGRMGIAAVEPPDKAWVGGNIGTPLISFVDEMQPGDLAVMELSSFQLEIMDRSPQVAAILNVTPNHLDRHGTMEAYTAAKAHILQHQTPEDVAVLGRDDPGAWSLRDQVQGRLLSFGFSELGEDAAGAYLYGEGIYVRAAPGDQDVRVVNTSDIRLRGMHNWLNAMAACTIAAAAGLPVSAMQEGIQDFSGVPHRLELVGRWGGAEWYNDSIATAPERAMAAVRAFPEEPLVLLAGGRDKNLPWEEFAALILRRVDHLVVFGEAAGIILAALEKAGGRPLADFLQGKTYRDGSLPTVTRRETLKEAVSAAADLVQPGDIVLLSPGGTSFDEFKDFEERGKCFAQWVRELR